MNKKTLIIFGSIVGVVLLASIIFAIVVQVRSNPPALRSSGGQALANNSGITTTTSTSTTTTTSSNSNNTNTASAKKDDSQAIYSVSRYFTEQYGSYSSDGQYANIVLLKPFMTDTMWTSAQALMAKPLPQTGFYSIKSQVANVKLDTYKPGDGSASVTVNARRTEVTSTAAPKLFSQAATIHLKQVNGSWKVDGLTWANTTTI